MSYIEAITAAGAIVTKSWFQPDYQGVWGCRLADDTYILDYFGSCSGCDNFEAHFSGHYASDEDKWDKEAELRKFGASYIDSCMSHKDFLAAIAERYSDSYHTDVRIGLLALLQ